MYFCSFPFTALKLDWTSVWCKLLGYALFICFLLNWVRLSYAFECVWGTAVKNPSLQWQKKKIWWNLTVFCKKTPWVYTETQLNSNLKDGYVEFLVSTMEISFTLLWVRVDFFFGWISSCYVTFHEFLKKNKTLLLSKFRKWTIQVKINVPSLLVCMSNTPIVILCNC